MAIYRVGDKVLVRSDLEFGKWYGEDTFEAGMKRALGEVVTIDHVDCGFNGRYHVAEIPEYAFTDEMFVGLATAKYKIGDKVKIREDLCEKEYDVFNGSTLYALDEMTEYAGKTATIVGIDYDKYYLIDLDNAECWWCDSMFEGLANEEETEETTFASQEEELFRKFLEKDKVIAKMAKILHERHNMSYKQIAMVCIESNL